MPPIVEALAILACIVADGLGCPIDSRYFELLGKLLESIDEIKQDLPTVEQKLDAIIIGDINAARLFLEKVVSPDFDVEEKRVAIEQAIHQLEVGYARLSNLPGLYKSRGEVAAHIGCCYQMLDKKVRARKWFNRSKDESKRIIAIPEKELSVNEHRAQKFWDYLDNEFQLQLGIHFDASSEGFKEYNFFKGIGHGAVGLGMLYGNGVFGIFPLSVSLPFFLSAGKKDTYNSYLKEKQKEANNLLVEIEKILACL